MENYKLSFTKNKTQAKYLNFMGIRIDGDKLFDIEANETMKPEETLLIKNEKYSDEKVPCYPFSSSLKRVAFKDTSDYYEYTDNDMMYIEKDGYNISLYHDGLTTDDSIFLEIFEQNNSMEKYLLTINPNTGPYFMETHVIRVLNGKYRDIFTIRCFPGAIEEFCEMGEQYHYHENKDLNCDNYLDTVKTTLQLVMPKEAYEVFESTADFFCNETFKLFSKLPVENYKIFSDEIDELERNAKDFYEYEMRNAEKADSPAAIEGYKRAAEEKRISQEQIALKRREDLKNYVRNYSYEEEEKKHNI